MSVGGILRTRAKEEHASVSDRHTRHVKKDRWELTLFASSNPTASTSSMKAFRSVKRLDTSAILSKPL